MRDVAAQVGISQQAVSLVFRNAAGVSDETRRRVFEAAAEIGYHPDAAAQVMRSHRSMRVGVLFSMQQPYEVDLVEALYPAAKRLGYTLLLGALMPGRDQRAAIEELLSSRCEAIILAEPVSPTRQVAELSLRLPIVDLGGVLELDTVDLVRSANDIGARLAVDHLTALGHRDIVHISGGAQPGAADRRLGYLTGMQEHGLSDFARVITGDYTEEAGAAAAQRLLRADRLPTAAFAANDRCAHGLLCTLVHAGIAVPDQMSIVGYDDSRVARLSYLDLTSIRQDPDEIAEGALRAIVERLDEGRTEPRKLILQPTLVTRGSTGAPAAVPR